MRTRPSVHEGGENVSDVRGLRLDRDLLRFLGAAQHLPEECVRVRAGWQASNGQAAASMTARVAHGASVDPRGRTQQAQQFMMKRQAQQIAQAMPGPVNLESTPKMLLMQLHIDNMVFTASCAPSRSSCADAGAPGIANAAWAVTSSAASEGPCCSQVSRSSFLASLPASLSAAMPEIPMAR